MSSALSARTVDEIIRLPHGVKFFLIPKVRHKTHRVSDTLVCERSDIEQLPVDTPHHGVGC